MAPRAKRLPLVSESVAVKCDACVEIAGGPACVASCPVEAIARVRPLDAFPAVRALAGLDARVEVDARGESRARESENARAEVDARGEPRRAAWPWVVAAAILGAAIARAPLGRGASGALAGALFALAAAYAIAKRWPRRAGAASARWSARVPFIAHLALGAACAGAVVAHAAARVPSNAAGALHLAFWIATATGALLAIAYRALPPLLARLERRGALPEDLAGRARELDERAFGLLTGKSEALKIVYARILRPYARAWLGAFAGARLDDEERRLRDRAARALKGTRHEGQLDGLDEAVALVVERRALVAQSIVQRVLRAGLPVHVSAAIAAIVLLVAHVVWVVRFR
jgi:hypothetical protein